VITINVRRCGRLGEHEPHEWTGRLHPQSAEDLAGTPKRIQFWCAGSVATEGSQRAFCENCGRGI